MRFQVVMMTIFMMDIKTINWTILTMMIRVILIVTLVCMALLGQIIMSCIIICMGCMTVGCIVYPGVMGWAGARNWMLGWSAEKVGANYTHLMWCPTGVEMKTFTNFFMDRYPSNTVTRQINDISHSRPRTQFSARMPSHCTPTIWNALTPQMKQMINRNQLKRTITQSMISSYDSNVACDKSQVCRMRSSKLNSKLYPTQARHDRD